MSEFPFPPPAWARPIPESLSMLPESGLLRWRAAQSWNGINELIEAIQGWVEWLHKLDSGENCLQMQAAVLADSVAKALDELCGARAIDKQTAIAIFGRFPEIPGDELGPWRESYDVEAAKDKLGSLGDYQTDLLRLQDALAADPLGCLCGEEVPPEPRRPAEKVNGEKAATEEGRPKEEKTPATVPATTATTPATPTDSQAGDQGESQGKGGRPQKWDDLVALDEELRTVNPKITDKEVVAKYNHKYAGPIGKNMRPKATSKALRDARDYRSKPGITNATENGSTENPS